MVNKTQQEKSKKKTVEKESVSTQKKVVTKAIAKVKASKTATTPVKPKQTTKVASTLTIDVVDTTGKVVKSLSLPQAVFGAKVNKSLMAQAVRVYLANQRSGTASTKNRGEVQGSTRKIYRQKGTGRARHGGIRAPIFVHGGIAHGPRPHDFSLKLSKKMKKQALFSALTVRLQDGAIKVVSGIESVEPKTKIMAKTLQSLALHGKKQSVMLVLPEKLENVQKAARNLANVEICLANQLNTYAVLRTKTMVFLPDTITTIEKHFLHEGENT